MTRQRSRPHRQGQPLSPAASTGATTSHDDGLECRLQASAAGQLEALKGAVARHIDRFAFREAPFTFHWQDTPNS